MPTVRLRVKSNAALVAVSSAHGEATFAIRGAWPDDGRLRLVLETTDVEPAALRATLAEVPSIRDVSRRSSTPEIARFELSTPAPEPHGAMGDSGVVPSFPQTVEGGWIVGELTAPRERLAAFRDELEAADIAYRVDLVTSAAEDGPTRHLTDRQREALELASTLGYYAYPRECTLTDVADALGVHKSVASRLLQRAEARIVAATLR